VVIYLWPTMFGAGRSGQADVDRLEALAVWTESLRDSIAGSLGLEQAIRHTRATAPGVLQPALQRLESSMDIRVSLPEALASFAEEFKDASADLVVSALILNSELRGRGLGDTLTRLAASAREEVEMRRRVEEGRKVLRRNALIVIGVTAVFAGGITLLSPAYVAPYGSPTGQVVLVVIIGVFAAGLMWMRHAALARPPERFLAGVDQITDAVRHTRAGGVR
jgi:Flp pilus assembly protein TadB